MSNKSKGTISRRNYLRLSASVLASGALAKYAPRPIFAQDQVVDVVIVGGGLSGLTAARYLMQAGIEDVMVLEAQTQVGGRTKDLIHDSGAVIEGGGQFVGPMQTNLLALAAAYGIETFTATPPGSDLFSKDGEASTTPPFDFRAFGEYGQVNGRIDEMASTIPLDHPWDAPNAAEWDAMTFGDFLDEHLTLEDARLFYELITFSTLNVLPEEISLLYFLYYVASAESMDILVGTTGAAQDSRFVGGPQRISLSMAEELGAERVILDSPVSNITQNDDGTVLVESARMNVTARRVIVALMPSLLQRINFTPPLPEQKQGLIEAWPISGDIKVAVVYETPFWREAGLNGAVVVSDEAAAGLTHDNTPPEGSPGVMIVWPIVSADPSLQDPDTRRQRILETLVIYFGEAALSPIDYIEFDWTDNEWSPACVSPLAPGVLTQYGAALRDPIGLIHWAGTETAEQWNGFMEGAVRAGERAAEEVLAALNS